MDFYQISDNLEEEKVKQITNFGGEVIMVCIFCIS